MATHHELDKIEDLGAREAVRIADLYLPWAPMKKRKALALEIVNAINLCNREFGNEIMRRVTDASRSTGDQS